MGRLCKHYTPEIIRQYASHQSRFLRSNRRNCIALARSVDSERDWWLIAGGLLHVKFTLKSFLVRFKPQYIACLRNKSRQDGCQLTFRHSGLSSFFMAIKKELNTRIWGLYIKMKSSAHSLEVWKPKQYTATSPEVRPLSLRLSSRGRLNNREIPNHMSS